MQRRLLTVAAATIALAALTAAAATALASPSVVSAPSARGVHQAPTVPAASSESASAPAPASAPATTAAPAVTDPRVARLATATAAVDRSHPGAVSVAVISNGVLRTAGPAFTVRGASILKLLIVDAAIDHGPVTGSELADVRKALQNSDNDAATRVWRLAGGNAAIARVVGELGLTHTRQVPVDLEPWDGWVTTAADQVRVIADVAARRGGLIGRLLADVESDQRWGVAAAAPRGTTAIGKDGWLPVSGTWLAHSDGCVTYHPGGTTCLAVLTQGSPSYAAGTVLATSAAAAAIAAVH